MKALILISLLSLSGCLLKNEPEHDPRFNPIRQQFYEDAKSFGVNLNPFNIKIAFGNVQDRVKFAGFVPLVGKSIASAEGVCGTIADTNNDIAKPFAKLIAGSNFKQKYIIIKKELEGESLGFLESLVYHELGHCALNLSHDDRAGIMSTNGIYELSYFRYFYLNELFKGEGIPNFSVSLLNDESEVLDSFEEVYRANYTAFDEEIDHTLYYDTDSEKYFSLDL